MIKGHYLIPDTEYVGYTIQDMWTDINNRKMINEIRRVEYIKALQGPVKLINQCTKYINMLFKRLINNNAFLSYTYKDNITKDEFKNIYIATLDKEYNSKDKYVADIINNMYRIDYTAYYCPIVTRL